MITLLWCLLWVQSLPLSLLSSFLLCVLCVLRVSWLWWTSLPTVGLTARGAPLWPLCVSADQGRGGAVVGAGWAWTGWIAMMMTMSAMASLVFCKLRCCGCLRNLWERLSCFAKSTELICRTNCYVLNIQRLQFFGKNNSTKDVFNCLWFEMNMKLILWLSLWMTSALSNSLEITNMHVQGVSWIFVK